MGKLARYIAKHEHPYTMEFSNGKGKIEVLFYEGYVTIRSWQPGTQGFPTEIHIKKKAWFRFLWYEVPQIKRVTKLMEGPGFDRYRAERRYYREEAKHLADQREMKRQLRPRSRRRAKVRRRRGQA